MIKRFKSKALVLTALLATGASLAQTNPSNPPSQTTAQAQVAASNVKLELFTDQPSESSQPLTTLEIGAGGGNLGAIEVPNEANKGRYLRISVTSAAGVQSYLYRVIAAPSTGRVFILTPDRHAIALNKFLSSSGLEVNRDRTVKLGAQAGFSTEATTPAASGEPAASASTSSAAPAPATSATPADTSTATTAPADSSTTTPAPSTPAKTSTTAAPSDSGSATAAPSDSSLATAPVDTSATTAAPSDSSSTMTAPADSSTATPADSSTATTAPPADASATAPAHSSTTTAAPSQTSTATAAPNDSSSASSDAKALTEPVNTTLGNVQLTVVPTGAIAPQSSASNFILVPITDAANAKSQLEGNVVTLSYASASSLEDVSKFYDDQLKAQGFARDDASTANQASADQVVSVYKRGNASVTITVRAEGGTYTVSVDLGNLAQATGN